MVAAARSRRGRSPAPAPASSASASASAPSAAVALSSAQAEAAVLAKPRAPRAARALPPLPLSARAVDQWLLAWYAIFFFTVMWTDLHNFSASLRTAVGWGGRSWSVQDLEQLVMAEGGSLIVPPRWLSYYYFRWARTADPLLYQNPIWWQCIEWVNLLCLMPFSLWALRAFRAGDNAVRLPAIIVSSFTFYSLILCLGASLLGDDPRKVSQQPAIFFFIYVPYLIFPALVVARLWKEQPFSRPLQPAVDAVVRGGAALVFASFALAGLAWYAKCEAGASSAANDAACPQGSM